MKFFDLGHEIFKGTDSLTDKATFEARNFQPRRFPWYLFPLPSIPHSQYSAMRSSRCAFSTAAALHRIFVAPIEQSYVRRIPLYPAIKASKPHLTATQQRSYASLPMAKQRLPRDDEIQYAKVHIVEDDNKLSPPRYTSDILHSIDRKTESLVIVALPSPPDPDSYVSPYPICKIQSKQALREAEKARKKKPDIPSATVKTVELNWAIDPHDLKHRLERVKDFLSKGWRVDIMMAGKKRGRKATTEEAEALVTKVKQALSEVDGSKEWKTMEGKVGGAATIFAEGKLGERG
jgi:translation initiation factor IF-3